MILIDYNAIAIGNVVTQKLDIDEDLVRHMILNSLRMHRAKHKDKFGELVICSDGGRNWRKDFFPPYKFKRKDARKVSKFDWKELFRITDMVFEELKEYFPYKVVWNDRAEADDCIAAIVETTQEFGSGEEVLIVSADKDFAQLQKYNNVSQWSHMQKKWIKEERPRRQLQELIMKGDTSDGVPNVLSNDDCFVEGVRQTPLRQKNLDEMINRLSEVTANLTNTPEWYRNYLRNQKLIDLTQTPKDIKEEIINSYTTQDKSNYKAKVFPYLVEKRCRRLLEDIRDFI